MDGRSRGRATNGRGRGIRTISQFRERATVGRGRENDIHEHDRDHGTGARVRERGSDDHGREHGTNGRGRERGTDGRGREHGNDVRGRERGADGRGRGRGTDGRGRERGTDGCDRVCGTDGHGRERVPHPEVPIPFSRETPFEYYLRCVRRRAQREFFNYDSYVSDMRRSLNPNFTPFSDSSSSRSGSPLLQQNPNQHSFNQNIYQPQQIQRFYHPRESDDGIPYPFQYEQNQNFYQQQQSQNLDQPQQALNPFQYHCQDPVQYLQIQCHFQYEQNENPSVLEQNQNPDNNQFDIGQNNVQQQEGENFYPPHESQNLAPPSENFDEETQNSGVQEQIHNSDESQNLTSDQNVDQHNEDQSAEASADVNASSLYDSIVLIMECKICFNTLIPPIFYCNNGHNICGNCRNHVRVCPTCRADFSRARNFIAEEILMKILQPCKYKDQGCNTVMLQEKKDEHEATCMFGGCECRMYVEGSNRCSWRGLRSNLACHIMDIHRETVDRRFNISFQVVITRDDLRNHCSLSIAFDEMFWCNSKYDANIGLLKTVQYIGPPENAKYFKYNFRYCHPSNCPALSYSNFVCSLNEDIDKLFDERRCFHITQETYATMTRNSLIKFQLELVDLRQ